MSAAPQQRAIQQAVQQAVRQNMRRAQLQKAGARAAARGAAVADAQGNRVRRQSRQENWRLDAAEERVRDLFADVAAARAVARAKLREVALKSRQLAGMRAVVSRLRRSRSAANRRSRWWDFRRVRSATRARVLNDAALSSASDARGRLGRRPA